MKPELELPPHLRDARITPEEMRVLEKQGVVTGHTKPMTDDEIKVCIVEFRRRRGSLHGR